MNILLSQPLLTLLAFFWFIQGNVSPTAPSSFTKTYSHQLQLTQETKTTYTWKEIKVFPFNELLVSWNAIRPKDGMFTIFIRVKGKKWSGWLKYAEWGASHQQAFSYVKDPVARLNGNAVTLKTNILASAFEIKVEASGGAQLNDFHCLNACVSNMNKYELSKPSRNLASVFIEQVPQQSQMILKHPHAKSMCSPTATSSVLSYFLQELSSGTLQNNEPNRQGIVDPVDFATLVYDARHNIYGNWALNVAAAYDVSGGKIPCRVEHLPNFTALYKYICHNRPVIVSIAGPLSGGATPYKSGHLMVVIGWDAYKQRVLCIDSAFKSNKTTKVWYNGDGFCKVWGRRKNLCYIFMPLS
jgi:hypothetical protein